ncbi:MAG: ribonuclease H-like domain-containing protein [Dehalococcoidales bacterium]
MQNPVEAYIDIETTGLMYGASEITVVGIYLCRDNETDFVQLVGRDITADAILETLEGVEIIYTYNGSRFDLPFIRSQFGIDLASLYRHRDLMYDCWSKNLHGGLKGVEKQVGIARNLPDMNGREAIKLWWQYVDSFDLDALNMLCEYNKEDVVNLKTLRDILI